MLASDVEIAFGTLTEKKALEKFDPTTVRQIAVAITYGDGKNLTSFFLDPDSKQWAALLDLAQTILQAKIADADATLAKLGVSA